MGLPLWREPSTKSSVKVEAKVAPVEAHSRVRSGRIQRRHGMHGTGLSQGGNRSRNLYPPPLDTFQPPSAVAPSQTGHLAPRRMAEGHAGVPLIPTLLDTADRQAPHSVPDSRNYSAAESTAATSHDTSVAQQARPEHMIAVGDRVRLIEETSRIVASLSGQDTVAFNGNSWLGRGTVDSRQRSVHSFGPPEPFGRVPTLHRERTSGENYSADSAVQATSNSRIDGLGDRNRSPTPPEEWEVMRSTIRPDATLPSAESSFTSAAASQSFTGSSTSTTVTGPDSSTEQHSADSDDDSISSIELADFCAEEESLEATESLARDMYYAEMQSLEGRERIAEQEMIRAREGNRFAMADEAPSVDIGFRLIEAALARVEERHRTLRSQGQPRSTADYGPDLTQLSGILIDDRARQVASRRPNRAQEPETSNDAPEAHPVALPAPRTHHDTEENVIANIERGEHDLDAMRQIVALLASRADVSDEWWLSMGLSLPRARPGHNRDEQSAVSDAALDHVRIGRIERTRDATRDRGGSRL